MSAQRSILTPWWQSSDPGQLGSIGNQATSFPALAGDFSGGNAVPDPFGGGLSAFGTANQQPANTGGQFADATQKAWDAAAKAAQNAQSTGGAAAAGQQVGTATTAAAPQLGAATGYATAGRTGSTYQQFLAANPNFDPWSNLDQFAGAGAGNDPIIAQAFGWTNEWARNNGFGDGSRIPLAQRQQVFLANLERARQQWSDNAANPQARQGVTWETSLARNIPNQGWSYTGPYGGGGAAPATPAGGGGNVSVPNYGLGLGAGAGAAAAAAQAAAQQANQGGGGGGAGGTNAFSGRFVPAAIANAAQDPRAALDMYNLATTGGTTSGHGPFSQFYESWFGPIMSAAINAMALNNGGQLPGNIDDLIGQMRSGMSGGTDLFGTLGTMGRTALQNAMSGGAGQSFDSLRNAISATNPLMTLGMSPIGRDVFYTGQQDALRDLQGRTYTMDNLGNNLTDWGQYFAKSPFAQQYLSR